jgi:hypothetical protein
MPDMDNGRLRHQGDSLDEDPESAFAFHQLLLEHGVDAYVCGHTHNTSVGKINGLWQLDPGHARGLEEASYADQMYAAVHRAIEEGKAKGIGEANSISQLYRDYEAQIEGRGQTRSSFFRVVVGGDSVEVEIYRDDARGGPYTLMHTVVLN